MDGTRGTVSDKQVQNHHVNILQMLDGFLSEYMAEEDSSTNSGSNWKPLRSDIRAVILSGDASIKGFEHLKAVLQFLFSSLQAGWLKDSIDPVTVMAFGAARMADHFTRGGNDRDVHQAAAGHDEL